jgi:tRNA(adenine34) deaminase
MDNAVEGKSDPMARALQEAAAAGRRGEVPVGAVVVRDGEILAAAGNSPREARDPTAHAEILAIRRACTALGDERLSGCDLYVTLEPCTMCAGAIVLARVPRVVFACTDPKAGAAGSVLDVLDQPQLNHRPEVVGGVLADEAAELLRSFFRTRRGRPIA